MTSLFKIGWTEKGACHSQAINCSGPDTGVICQMIGWLVFLRCEGWVQSEDDDACVTENNSKFWLQGSGRRSIINRLSHYPFPTPGLKSTGYPIILSRHPGCKTGWGKNMGRIWRLCLWLKESSCFVIDINVIYIPPVRGLLIISQSQVMRWFN